MTLDLEALRLTPEEQGKIDFDCSLELCTEDLCFNVADAQIAKVLDAVEAWLRGCGKYGRQTGLQWADLLMQARHPLHEAAGEETT